VIALLLAAILPQAVRIATPRGETSLPVTTERGAAAVAAPLLAQPLGLVATLDAGRATRVTVGLGDQVFVFHLGMPFVRVGSAVYALVGAPYVARDTLFLPLHWLAECVPLALAARYRWDPVAARLEEVTAAASNPLTGLRQSHAIVIDPGHGGDDPGNPGRYFPGDMAEKDVTLAIGRLLRAELTHRGLIARLTRSRDTLIDLADRGTFCAVDCDLFVSIHVNAMPPGRRQESASGAETYFLSDAKTEDQKRVAKMENDAIRFETGAPGLGGDVGFIIRDLQQNEYLRESARLAELVQGRLRVVHPGEDRGVQQAGFVVLTTARRPAILVETGFATNKRDGEYLASALGQRKIADAIADGIVAYLVEFERKLAVGGPGR
jgi:N-acetylmuramoyl-L-alanine amidase